MPRSDRLRRAFHVAATILLVLVALTLQGCLRTNSKSMSIMGHVEDDEPSSAGPERVDSTPMADPQAIHNKQCDSAIESESDAFQEVAQKSAENYYAGLVQAFSLDFIRFPFCLENQRYMVGRMEKHLRSQARFEGYTIAEMDNVINNTLAKVYPKHEERWKECCKDWAERNIEYQHKNLDMVREVLQVDRSVDDDQLKAEIQAFFDWNSWWKVFGKLARTGCTKRYTMICTKPSEEAREKASQKIRLVMNSPDMTWYAFPDPLIERQHSETAPEDPSAMRGGSLWDESSSRPPPAPHHEETASSGPRGSSNLGMEGSELLEARHHVQAKVPVEIRAGGHQIRGLHGGEPRGRR